ncbi:MAG: dTMP kinase [Gammaproteobacteria bacterium GWF2_41_13]|nr:MAG: dTMP kinase [Gammaproteobacteria bacterium GWF2_41_13]
MSKGLFITLEGIEGAGKSTVVQHIREYFDKKKRAYVVTREPGGTEIAEAIRHILLNHYQEKMADDTELLLFFAGRAQHIARVIQPALVMGKMVLCDRFTDASFAYQCGGRGIPEERVAILEKWVQGDLQPDLTLLLDVSPEIGAARIAARKQLDRFEIERLAFFKKVRQHYLERAIHYSNRYRIIDANQSENEVKQAVELLLDQEVSRNE